MSEILNQVLTVYNYILSQVLTEYNYILTQSYHILETPNTDRSFFIVILMTLVSTIIGAVMAFFLGLAFKLNGRKCVEKALMTK